MIDAADVVEQLEEFCVQFGHILPGHESICRPMVGLQPQEKRIAWQQIMEQTGGKQPTGQIVKSTVERLKPKPRCSVADFCEVGDVFTLTKLEGEQRKYNGYPCIAIELKHFNVEVDIYDGRLIVKPQNLKPVDSPDVHRQLPAIIGRLKRLRQYDLDRSAYPILELLGRRTYLTDFEDELLTFIEQRHGIDNKEQPSKS